MKPNAVTHVLALSLALLGATTATVALGADPTEDQLDAKPWRVEWTTWLALPFMDGDASAAGSSIGLDLGPRDIFDAADTLIGGQGRLEVWYDDQCGLIVEAMGSLIEAEESISATPVIPLVPVVGANVDITWEFVLVDIEGAYRIHEGPLGDGGMRWLLDGMAGLRVNHFKQEVDLSGLAPLGLGGTVGGTEDWVEPIVGARIGIQIDKRWSLGVRGNVGGFGLGEASDISWRLAAGVGYQINERLGLKAGYQVYGLDYDNGESGLGQIGFDGLMHGPVMGLTLSF